MKKFAKKTFLATVCACLFAFSGVFSACTSGSGSGGKAPAAPDYSATTRRFDSYAYSGPTDGTYSIDGETFNAGQDFRTYERFVEYKEAGFSILLAQSSIPIDYNTPTVWDEKYAPIMDAAYAAGLKVILTDGRIQKLTTPVGVTATGNTGAPWTIGDGENDKFASYDALDETMKEYLSLYINHPAFYGIMLGDEPSYQNAENYGMIYKSVLRAAKSLGKDIFIQYNLLPLTFNESTLKYRYPLLEDWTIDSPEAYTEENVMRRYKKYLELFLDATGADYVQYDSYPIQKNGLLAAFLPGIQMTAELAKERGIEFRFVAQTFSMLSNQNLSHKQINEGEARWMNNILIGFGIRQISYFTYWTKQHNVTTGETFVDGASFITRAGEKTEIYYFMQKIMAENQKFAPVIFNFDYQGSNKYFKLPLEYPDTQRYLEYMKDGYEFAKLTSFDINKETAIVTELKDKTNDRYMYMVMNVVDANKKGSKAYQTATLEFAGYENVAIYRNGEVTTQKLVDGKVTVKLAAADAAFVLPY